MDAQREPAQHDNGTQAGPDLGQQQAMAVTSSYAYNAETSVKPLQLDSFSPPVTMAAAERRHLADDGNGSRSLLQNAIDINVAPPAVEGAHSVLQESGYLVPTDDAYAAFDGSMPQVYAAIARTSLFKQPPPTTAAAMLEPLPGNASDLVTGDDIAPVAPATGAETNFLVHHYWQEVSELPLISASTNMSKLIRSTTVVR